ncbi:MAG: phosphate regulon transcriptional regulatory protein PhoB [Alphaproteobacteria bacterium]|nr:phosphate regulon transcriptional regulatory protein PhoB [Alphaproteobacteria bacterium]
MPHTILVVEDDPSLAELLRYNLTREGFAVTLVHDGDSALHAAIAAPPDLVVLDWMIPGLSGIEVCRRLRRRPESKTVPIIMLTARGEEADRVEGLESGADDYMVKPFSPGELAARIRAVLRRAGGDWKAGSDAEIVEAAGVRLDQARHRVTRAGREIHLGPTEFRLLKTLMERPGRVLSREQLLDRVWGRDIHVETRTVDAHVRRLRKALNAAGDDVIRTVRGAGYAFRGGEE